MNHSYVIYGILNALHIYALLYIIICYLIIQNQRCQLMDWGPYRHMSVTSPWHKHVSHTLNMSLIVIQHLHIYISDPKLMNLSYVDTKYIFAVLVNL